MTWILPKQLISAFAPDTEALTLDSAELSRICEQSLMRRSKHSPAKTYLREWKLGNLMRLRSGVISSPSLGKSFLDWWTSSLEVTHANRSQPQESGLEQKILVTSGPTSQTVFEFSDLGSASLRTSKVTSALDSEKSLENWKSLVTKRRLEYSARLNAVRHISESGSSSWPTAATRDYKGQSGSGRQERKGHPADTLPNAMAQWTSPVASEVRQGFQDRSRGMKGSQESLTTVVIKSWPTPNCMDVITPNRDLTQMESKGHWGKNMNTGKLSEMVNYGPPVPASSSTDGSRPESWQTATVSTGAHKQKDGSMIDKLDQQVKNWATARAGMARGNNFTYDRGKGNIEEQAGASVQGGGKLNPRWVETLMGLPVGWTMPSCASPVTIERMNSDSSATELSQQQQNERSGH